MGWSDIGAYGSEIDTPNIDGLAQNGMIFRDCYNSAKCFPSRATAFTGAYAAQVNMNNVADSYLENAVTIGEVLQTAGYRTLATGKYHGLDNLYDRGFDRYYGLRDGASNHFKYFSNEY